LLALNWMMAGAVMPGGRMRRMLPLPEEIWAMALAMSVPGWK
jgi:hypothetical protein